MKQATHYSNICAVTVAPENTSYQSDPVQGSGSGLMIDTKHGLILTHASLLSPLISKIHASKLRELRNTGYMDNCFTEKLQFEVFLPNYETVSVETGLAKKHNISKLNCNLLDAQPYSTHNAYFKMAFVCRSLSNTIERLFPVGSWQFVTDTDDGEHSTETTEYREKNETYYSLISCFLLLKLKKWTAIESILELRSSLDNRQGDAVEICATPFGGLSPEVFLNSHSRGILSNVAGPRKVLLMTDARCVPGSEGGALFYCNGKQRILTGIIVASLCWKNNEWVGLSLACAISELMGSLHGHVTSLPQRVYRTSSRQASITSGMLSLVPLVSVGHGWGSGVIVDPARGLVVTCSHVLKGSDVTPVKVRFNTRTPPATADVIYKTSPLAQFDIGVVALQTLAHRRRRRAVRLGTVNEGDVVYVVGHAVFAASSNLPPTVTMGIVSKVIVVNNIPIMIQTTCAVHAGASGGAVFSCHGDLVAIVVCNSKDTISNACYPHVNMCVPMETISPVLEAYINTGDESVLEDLHIDNEKVQRIWSIGTVSETKADASRL